ncbi:AAA family ATPase [Candidatus Woesearchaeota archaeon]|jgi:dCMP deaminase|nr:AAA family ATPase [Candidatus Woesearchaeota archaeon]
MIVIGLTGTNCAGKDSVAEYLVAKGFIHLSLSDIIREELKLRKQPITRDNLIELGNELRKNYGYGVLAERALRKVNKVPGERYVISSIRHSDEAKKLKKHKNFFLINVDAPVKIRFDRMTKRNNAGDAKTLKEFKSLEKREFAKSGAGQQIGLVIKLAKITILNNAGEDELHNKVDSLLNDLNVKLVKSVRPTKEQYYLNIASEIATRSTCLSVQFGSVIVKDDQIIATGYIGAPRKTDSCVERGFCLRRRLKIPSGQRYELCRSVHSEMNAIINAARSGASILESDLFLSGIRIYEGQRKPIDMHPCFICKKLIINAGIGRVICSQEDGSTKTFIVSDWVKDWQGTDLIDDVQKYDAKYYAKTNNK